MIKLKHINPSYALNLACKELSYKPQLHTTSYTRLIKSNHQLKERVLAHKHDYKFYKFSKNTENKKMQVVLNPS